MNFLHDVSCGSPEKLNVIIEIPKGSCVKYEVDKETGLIKFDRALYSPVHYPTNYGFVPQTWWEDDDPLDVMVLGQDSIYPGTLVETRPIGFLEMTDGGASDVKVLAVPVKEPRFKNTNDIQDLEPHLLDEIKHFFSVYKQLEGKIVEVGDWKDVKAAGAVIEKAMAAYREKFK